jgi:DNA polymerase III delta prime subunit
MTDKLFINKYQPLYFKDFGDDNEIIKILDTLIKIDDLNILLIGDMTSGKTSILNALIREYYEGLSPKDYEDNVMYINSLKEQGINYYRTDVKTFCQTCSNIKNKKKIIVLDDIDFINEQSQQVFRNYIDKYSKNIHFISVCTNIQKVNESLQSRLHILKINQVNRANLETTMNKIIEKEGLIIDADSKDEIGLINAN